MHLHSSCSLLLCFQELKFFKNHLNLTRVNIFCRCVDELESQLSKHGSLKKLYFYHQHLTTVSLYCCVTRIILQIFSKQLDHYADNKSFFSGTYRCSEIQCLARKVVHSIVVLGLGQLAVFQNVLLQFFLKRCIFEFTI